MRRIGYARVSTIGQTLDMQIQTLNSFECHKVFREKASGADVERVELRRLIKNLCHGDTVVIPPFLVGH
ncbi:recombinase family protein [Acetobacter pasteurianus]|nr:recombinase family protein [Acetobacter pasteurianus]GCD73700.1 DNA resolvase [Acetobacter pasteurianus NBRC 3284]